MFGKLKVSPGFRICQVIKAVSWVMSAQLNIKGYFNYGQRTLRGKEMKGLKKCKRRKK